MNYPYRFSFILKLLVALLLTMQTGYASLEMVMESYQIIDDRAEEVELQELFLDELPLRTHEILRPEDLSFLLDTLINNHQIFSHASATIKPIRTEENRHYVHLLIELQRHRRVKAVRLLTDGEHDIQSNLLEKLQTQRNHAFSSSRIEGDVNLLKKHFFSEGFPDVEVNVKAEELNSVNDLLITFEIRNVRKTTRIYELHIEVLDRDQKLNNEIKSMIQEASAYKPRNFFLASRPLFDVNLVEEDEEKIKRILNAQGYEEANVQIVTKRKKELIEVTYRIELGMRYMIGQVSYLSNGVALEKLQTNDSPLLTKNTPFTEVNFRREMERIRQLYGKHGHLFTKVMGSFDRYDGHLQFIIAEGPKFNASSITIEGLEELRIDRALLDLTIIASGDITQPMIDQQIKKFMNTGHYSHVESEIVVDEHLQETTDRITGKIIFHVKESKEREIRFSLGTGQAGPSGELAYTMNHVGSFGGRLSVFASLSSELRKVGIIFQDPHVGGTDWQGKYTVQYDDRENDYEDSSRLRFKALFEKQVAQNLTAGIGARIEFVKADLLHQYIDSAPLVLRSKHTISGLLGTLTYAQVERDSTNAISQGRIYRAILMPSYSEEGAYTKAILEAIETIELGKNQWGSSHSIQGRILIAATTSNSPEIERFKAGGAGTIRGFQRQSIRNADGSGALGMLSSNVSYSFPLYKKNLKGVLFLEAASLSEDLKSLGSFRVVGGFGVRANLGQSLMAPQIEAGLAFSLKDKKGDKFKPFYLMFGEYDPRFDL